MFAQGQFLIDPNAPPEEIVRKRAALNKVMRAYGRANNIGEGVGDLLTGVGQGIQNRRVGQAERAQAESANSMFDSLFGGGEPASPTIDAGGFPSAPSSPGFPPPPAAPSGTITPPADIPVSYDGDLKSGIATTAEALGIDPVDLATAISYETAGTFDPTKRGPTTQWGQHRGLIQFGEPQAQKYGVNWDDPVGSQLGPEGAVAKYLRDTGVQPGMGLLDIYSAINAGGVGRYNRSDANNGGAPGTVRDKVEQQMAGHRAKALAMFGGSQPQSAAQAVNAMAQPEANQEPIMDPLAYNQQNMRMSPDLAGEPMPVERAPLPMRQPTPQGQAPIPGIQPTAPSMQDMAGRMPAPEGQPMAQGRDALAAALMQQQAEPQAQQAIEQAAPQEVDPRGQFNSPQLNAADPTQGILKVLMERGGQPAQASPAVSRVQQAMQGQGETSLDLNKAIELMNNPFLSAGKKAVLGTMIERQMAQQDPAAQLDMEYKRAQLEQLRNPTPKPTADIQEYEFAKSQGFQGSYLDFQTSLKKAGATNVTTNLGEGDKFYENLDKKNAETFSALSETGMQGRSKLAQIDRLDGLLAAAPQGAAAMLKQVAGEYGINTEGLSDIQAAQALINELVPQQRQPGSGPMSDADLALFKESLPRLINQPEGNRAIIDTMRGITQYQIQMGDIADAVANREMTPAEGRKAIASLANPLEGFGKIAKGTQQQQPTASKPISEMTDEELEALVNGD